MSGMFEHGGWFADSGDVDLPVGPGATESPDSGDGTGTESDDSILTGAALDAEDQQSIGDVYQEEPNL